MDLLDALRRPEGKTLEFKRNLSSPEGLLRTVVAFANTAGGVVLVGVEDGTRHVRGIADPFALEERIGIAGDAGPKSTFDRADELLERAALVLEQAALDGDCC